MTRPLLEVNNLTTRFRTERGTVTAVDGVSFHVDPGETLAIVGESGSGKSVTALSVLRLIPDPPGRIESGEILFDGADLVKLDDPGIRAVRGNKIAMIFQEPMSSLNPALTVGLQVAEPINVHRGTPWAKAYEAATELIGRVRIADAASRLDVLSAPVFRRHAPARHDRDGAGLRAAPDHRRRADHRARRHGAGADPRSPERGHARDRLVADPDHPRSRRGRALCRSRRGDVWRAHCRGGAGARALRPAAASLHARPDGLRAAARWRAAAVWCRSKASRRISRACRRAVPSRRAAGR